MPGLICLSASAFDTSRSSRQLRRRLVLEGVYRGGADGAPDFVETKVPTDDDLHALLQTVNTRPMKMLTRRGILIEEMRRTYLAEPTPRARSYGGCRRQP